MGRNWQEEVSAIYAGYAIYTQSGGAEQLAFDPSSGQAAPRSWKLLEWAAGQGVFGVRGRILDVGCGNGGLLRSFSALRPGWELSGTELDERNRATVLAIPGVVGFHTGTIDELTGQFDAISMLHVLEHIPDPARFLRSVRDRLDPGGLLLVEVPDFSQNPFELLIADHCTHFTQDRLVALLASAGFRVHAATSACIPKEISVLALKDGPSPGQETAAADALESARAALDWLAALVTRARELVATRRIGIFGTAIAGSWLFGEIEEGVEFFVDEDSQRIGKRYLGRPVLHPDEIPLDAQLLIPLPPAIACAIARRIQRPGIVCHLPPPLDPPRRIREM